MTTGVSGQDRSVQREADTRLGERVFYVMLFLALYGVPLSIAAWKWAV